MNPEMITETERSAAELLRDIRYYSGNYGNPWNMAQIKRANQGVGGHWFDVSTLRFFGSRVGNTVYQGLGGIFFVSSEASDVFHVARAYTVRQFNPSTAMIDTVGPFNQYSYNQAVRRATQYAATGVPTAVSPSAA